MDPHSRGPHPSARLVVPPSQASWPNEFDHLSKKISLAGNVSMTVPCKACHTSCHVITGSDIRQLGLLALVII